LITHTRPHTLSRYTTLFRSSYLFISRLSPAYRYGRWRVEKILPKTTSWRGDTSAGSSSARRYLLRTLALSTSSGWPGPELPTVRSAEHTSELQSRENLVCRL